MIQQRGQGRARKGKAAWLAVFSIPEAAVWRGGPGATQRCAAFCSTAQRPHDNPHRWRARGRAGHWGVTNGRHCLCELIWAGAVPARAPAPGRASTQRDLQTCVPRPPCPRARGEGRHAAECRGQGRGGRQWARHSIARGRDGGSCGLLCGLSRCCIVRGAFWAVICRLLCGSRSWRIAEQSSTVHSRAVFPGALLRGAGWLGVSFCIRAGQRDGPARGTGRGEGRGEGNKGEGRRPRRRAHGRQR